MLQLRVMEESRSGWSNPVVLVPKPDGSFRFCNNFRRLNEVSDFDAYPMPRVDELIERLGPARYLTTLDLTKGFWQVPARERQRLRPRGDCTSTPSSPSASMAHDVPADDGPNPSAQPGLRSSLHRRHHYPQRQLRCPPLTTAGGPGGVEKGRAYSQPRQVPPGTGGDDLPGVPSQTGERPATG